MTTRRAAIITGDVAVDWNLARSHITQRTGALWDPGLLARCYKQIGGAALLGELIGRAASPLGHTVHSIKLDTRRAVFPGSPGLTHSYTLCARYPSRLGDSVQTWRMKEFLGVDKYTGSRANRSAATLNDDDGKADLIVIDDADQGFRALEKTSWPPSLLRPKDSAWVLIKLARPDFSDPNLLSHVRQNFAKRILLVLTVNDLRGLKLRISRELSWERAIYDLISELRNSLDGLREIGKCVVSFHTEGAAVLPNPQTEQDIVLYYDPHSIEGTWGTEYPGTMAGYTQCLTAGIALNYLQVGDFNDLGPGVIAGLNASRLVHRKGFIAKEENLPIPTQLSFPTQAIADEIRRIVSSNPTVDYNSEFSRQAIAYDQGPNWSILQSRYPDLKALTDLAIGIVSIGPEKAMSDIPVAKFGKFISLERSEIEGMRQIRALISEYRKPHDQEKPLSIAVFGAPGSGKSFAITSVAESLSPTGTADVRQFNLSQFASPSELLGAFHQVRDDALKGIIPLVFWDEFDSDLSGQELGWIRYFLAPMQDGLFQHGELAHPIGRAIFVFAGGTCQTLKEFEKSASKHAAAKVPDFLSRLKGYVDVAGLDHRPASFAPNVVLRRALLLRTILLKAAPDLVQRDGASEKLQVDPGVLNAFLFLREYKHGIRSLESVVRMSFLTGKESFDRSSLPSEDQIELHVDPEEFIGLVKTNEPIPESDLSWNN